LFDNTSQTQQHNASEWIGGESNLFKLSNLLFKNIKSNDKDNKVSKEQLKDIVSTANNNYCTNLWQCFGECVFIFLRKKMCECNEKHLSNALLCVVDKTKQEEKKLRNEQNESELINKKRSDYVQTKQQTTVPQNRDTPLLTNQQAQTKDADSQILSDYIRTSPRPHGSSSKLQVASGVKLQYEPTSFTSRRYSRPWLSRTSKENQRIVTNPSHHSWLETQKTAEEKTKDCGDIQKKSVTKPAPFSFTHLNRVKSLRSRSDVALSKPVNSPKLDYSSSKQNNYSTLTRNKYKSSSPTPHRFINSYAVQQTKTTTNRTNKTFHLSYFSTYLNCVNNVIKILKFFATCEFKNNKF
ncbi:hypothetical protein RFI_00367, partial [Reticulomyxa filosa]